MKYYYVFNDEQTAIDAQDYICLLASTPVTGVNADTGLYEPNKEKTTKWADVEQRLDGKWVFECIPLAVALQFPPEISDAFNTNFPNTKEEFNSSWFATS